MNFSVIIYAKLNHKYHSQFNFHFSKSINQIVFNQTIATSTITFKDAAIYSESIEYLKRQYYLMNQIGIQEIFQRIGMLAGFYYSAVLLRFQYPMMIVTKTKDVFLKRLKRNKKMLTEEGSSDESKSNSLSRSVQLHTNTFLDSVNSSELSKKTAQLRDELFPEFRQKRNEDKSYDLSIHDIHNPLPSFENSIVHKRESVLSEESFADKLLKLSKNISLNEMIDSEAVEVNLTPIQSDISFLICDFDEIDKQQTIKNYEKLKSRDKENFNVYQLPGHQQDCYGQRFKKKSKMFITPFEENAQYSNHEKTLQNPKSRRLPKQMQFSAMQKQLKSRPVYSQENRPYPKMSAFHQTKNSLFMDTEDGKFNQHEESYKTLERFRTSNGQKPNQHQMKHIYDNNRQGYEGGRGKANSYQQNGLPRTRSNNVFNIKRQIDDFNDYDHVIEKSKGHQPHAKEKGSYSGRQKVQMNGNQFNQRYVHGQPMNQRYSAKNRQNRLNERYVTQFDVNDQNQRASSPRFAFINDQEAESQKFSIYSKHSSKAQDERKAVYMPGPGQKYYVSGFADTNAANKYRHPEQIHTQMYRHQIPASSLHQQNMDDKIQKKKKLREKAAQLLSRVKSQQYLTSRNQVPYIKRY